MTLSYSFPPPFIPTTSYSYSSLYLYLNSFSTSIRIQNMGFDHNSCNTGLSLGGVGSTSDQLFFNIPKTNLLFDDDDDQRKKMIGSSILLTSSDQSSTFPCLTLGLSTEVVPRHVDATTDPTKKVELAGESMVMMSLHRQSSSISTVSTFSNSSVKREREFSGTGEEVEEETKVSSKARLSNIDDQDDQARKKLRLTKEQSLVLEERFKEHSTLNPKQKHALATRLDLSPRQVEVWFQNRRARTKLKQNELDCELLKTCCDSLTEENRRLKKEIQELKSIKLAGPFYMQFPAATLTMCPSCEKIAAGVCHESSSKSPFPAVGPKRPQFLSGFTCPSAAPC